MEDPAARYLALGAFNKRRAADVAALDKELEKKRGDRNFKKALGIMAPVAIAYCCTHPAGWAVLGIMKVASSGLILLSPSVHISESMRKGGFGRKKLQAEMQALYAPLHLAQSRAADEMTLIAGTRMDALARSPLADKITALDPALKDAMLQSFRAAAAREGQPDATPESAPEAIPAPAPRAFKL